MPARLFQVEQTKKPRTAEGKKKGKYRMTVRHPIFSGGGKMPVILNCYATISSVHKGSTHMLLISSSGFCRNRNKLRFPDPFEAKDIANSFCKSHAQTLRTALKFHPFQVICGRPRRRFAEELEDKSGYQAEKRV
jgi:hypothetical protein